MIFDCFPFHNELDLLELRLQELEGVVDRHVLVESRLTHSGLNKPLYYLENKDRFRHWSKKIHHLIIEHPSFGGPWDRENEQRNMAFPVFARDDDWVIISDLDEIPSRKIFDGPLQFCWGAMKIKRPIHLAMRNYYYYMNLRAMLDLHSAVVVPYWMIGRYTPQVLRYTTLHRDEILPDAGWHFTYMGGVQNVIQKMESFAHAGEAVNSELIQKFKAGEDPVDVDFFKLTKVPINQSTHPESVWKHKLNWRIRGFIL